jgi:hypothetical protein
MSSSPTFNFIKFESFYYVHIHFDGMAFAIERNGSYKGGFVSRASSSLTTMTFPTPVHIIELDKR